MCEIYLTTNASLVILNCPTCLKPVIYHKKKCLPLTKQQAVQIETASHESTIYNILQKIINRGGDRKPVRSFPARKPEPVTACHQSFAQGGISHDDITNLKIELETCFDSRAFIEKM
ncbi:MAG: hypothetical protein GF350_09915 [Chitinivibrionales bacterium]|nr:hypothetical protein [Chitinivibrionales bacterium]